MTTSKGRVRAVVLTDTHIQRDGRRRLPDAVLHALDGADAILHAGDVVTPEVLDELRGFAPVYAVLGNNDFELRGISPESRIETFAGVTVAMIHDTGATSGRGARMVRRFPVADVLIYGHSHMPDDHDEAGIRLFNPGSCLERRRSQSHSYGELVFADGAVIGHRVVAID